MGTTTPDLGLSQPTPGDPGVANIWGTILNTNFGLIDSAVAGLLSLSVAGSSNVVLTNTNGAADQERNAIFIFTGALTGNINVLYPNGKTKVFSVKNSTSGAFTLSLGVNNGSGAPAGSVAVVAAGGSGTFYSDGTNVFNLSISSANPTFTGTVTGPDLGTWTATGLDGITKLGIGITGSSNLLYVRGANGIVKLEGTGSPAYFRLANVSSEFGFMGDSASTMGVSFSALDMSVVGTRNLLLDSIGGFLGLYIASAEKARVGSDGSFLVGSTTNAGAGAIGAAGNITAFYSDERLKDRVGPVTNALEKVMSLSAFYYHANDFAKEASGGIFDPNIREVGLSAQEVEAVLPEVVAPAPFNHDYKTLRYDRIVALLIAAIQEQQAQIEILKAAK